MPAKADIGTGGLRGRLHPAKNDLKLGTKPRLGWKAVFFFSVDKAKDRSTFFSLPLRLFSFSLSLLRCGRVAGRAYLGGRLNEVLRRQDSRGGGTGGGEETRTTKKAHARWQDSGWRGEKDDRYWVTMRLEKENSLTTGREVADVESGQASGERVCWNLVFGSLPYLPEEPTELRALVRFVLGC